jgi:hypothetical protein
LIIPQLIILALILNGLACQMRLASLPKTPVAPFFKTLIGSCAWIGLLYWGGFFDELILRLTG